MFVRGHAQASPSVTLEKGVPRLRFARPAPPRLRYIREEGRPRAPFPSDADRQAAALLAAIALATLLAVCLLLYFLSHRSRWELSPLQFLYTSELPSSSPAHPGPFDPFLTPLPDPRQAQEYSPASDLLESQCFPSREHYISYLPHSGFHNQRISLENALVLAYILNRTLLIPPIYLGEIPIPYQPAEILRDDIALSSQIGLEHCARIGPTAPVPDECSDFWTHAQLPWDWLVDLAPAVQKHAIRVVPRQDLTDAFLTCLGITSTDTFFLNDTTPYEFRFFDHNEDTAPVGPRYSARINLPELDERARAYRLLQFGTLFGTMRLRLAHPLHAALRRDVRRAMVFTNPDFLAYANAVAYSKALGGQWEYVAVHLRLGDGVFADEDAPFRNVRHVWWRLIRELGVDDQAAAELETRVRKDDLSWGYQPPPPRLRDFAALRAPRPTPLLPPAVLPSPELTCTEAPHPLLRVPLYIATDQPAHPALGLFMRTFPCVYFLGNFSQLVDVLIASPPAAPESAPMTPDAALSTSPRARLVTPFLDALVASKARVVVGTPGSTFSRFVEDVLWRRYHGWEIVERG